LARDPGRFYVVCLSAFLAIQSYVTKNSLLVAPVGHGIKLRVSFDRWVRRPIYPRMIRNKSTSVRNHHEIETTPSSVLNFMKPIVCSCVHVILKGRLTVEWMPPFASEGNLPRYLCMCFIPKPLPYFVDAEQRARWPAGLCRQLTMGLASADQ
jgi:hypothetical protein